MDVLDQSLYRGAVLFDPVRQRIAHDRRELGQLLVLARSLLRGWEIPDVGRLRRGERLEERLCDPWMFPEHRVLDDDGPVEGIDPGPAVPLRFELSRILEELDVTGYLNGLYLVKITGKDVALQTKFVVLKD